MSSSIGLPKLLQYLGRLAARGQAELSCLKSKGMGSPTSGTAQGEVTPHCTRASLDQKSSKATIQGTDPECRGNSCSWQGTEEEPILGGKDGVSPQPPSTSSAPGAKADVVPTSARDHGSAFPQAHQRESVSLQVEQEGSLV